MRRSLAAAAGGSIIPPVILSMDEFVDMLYEKGEGEAGKKLEAIDAVALLYRIHCAGARPLGGDRFIGPEGFLPMGLTLYRDLEELCIEGIEPARVRGIESLTDEAVPEMSAERLQSLSTLYERLYRTVREHRYSTRALRYRDVAERFDRKWISGFRTVLLAGFYALTAAERTLFRKIGEDERSTFVFHSGRGLKERLERMQLPCDVSQGQDRRPTIRLYRSPDTHGQVLALGAVLGATKKGGVARGEGTAVVLPSSDALFPLVSVGLSALGDDEYNVSLGYPLVRTPLFAFLRTLMEAVGSMEDGRVYVPAYLRFVLHPYTKNISGALPPEGTRVMFHVIEERLRSLRTRSFVGLDEIEGDEEMIRRIAERVSPDCSAEAVRRQLRDVHRNTVERFRSFRDIRDFSDAVREVLTYLYDHSTARLHPFFHPYAVAFVRAIDVLSRSLLSPVTLSDRGAYFLFLKKYLSTCHVPFEGTPLRGLQVLGFLETRNLKFDRVFILDVNEGVLPETGRDETILPSRARELLGLPTYRDRDRLISYYFETLLQGAREVHLFYVENDTRERSRFIERVLWEDERTNTLRNERDPARPISYRVNLVQKEPGEVAKDPNVSEFLRTFTYTATSLDSYLSCPLRFYYRYVVNLKEKEELSAEIGRPDIGRVVHGALARFFSVRRGQPLRREDLSAEAMGRVVEEVFEREYGAEVSGATFLMKHQVKAHLQDLLNRYYAPLAGRTGLTVRAVEHVMAATWGRYALSGRLDCIEQRGDETVVVDYKTTGRPDGLLIRHDRLDPDRRDTWRRAIGSVQLPFYLCLLRESSGHVIERLNGVYLLLGRSVIDGGIELPLFAGGEERAPLFDMLLTVMVRLMDEIGDPSVPFRATEDKKEACPACAYTALCGTQWIAR